MAMLNLSQDREFRYIICWFTEFSELQREDFIEYLAEYLTTNTLPNGNGVHVNGLVHTLDNATITNKPMSLFQCRMKLFREWSAKWPLDYKRKLQDRIIEIDPKIGEKLMHKTGLSNGSALENGGDESGIVTDDIVNAAVAIVNATEEAIITAMLNNETSVDDNNDNGNNDAHVIEPAGQVETHVNVQTSSSSPQELQQPSLVISTQTSVSNSAEVPLLA